MALERPFQRVPYRLSGRYFKAMSWRPRKRWLAPAVLCLLVAGVALPILAAGTGVSSPTTAQLSSLVSAADQSSVYAHSVVGYASREGIDMSSSQSLLGRGDSLLVTAKADLQAGGNLSAGVTAVHAAMVDYTSAATTASLALGEAGLLPTVDYAVVVQAIAETNSTARALASVSSAVCAQAAGSSGGSAGFSQACAGLNANLEAAGASLSQASELAARAQGGTGAGANLSQAMVLVASARASLNSSQSELQTIASYGYVQRAQAYVATVIHPLSARANSTLASEEAANSSFARFQQDFSSYMTAQSSSSGNITERASVLEAAIASVDVGPVASGASVAEDTARQVSSNLSALLSLPGIDVYTVVVSDAKACQSQASAFTGDVAAANVEAGSYGQTGLASFSSYVAAMQTDDSNVQASGNTYLASYNQVVSDLSPLQGVPGVSQIFNNLNGLQVSGSIEGVSNALSQSTTAMSAVESGVGAYDNAVATLGPGVVVGASLLSEATAGTGAASAYLNATGASAMQQVSTSLSTVSQLAESFVASAGSATNASVGAFSGLASSLSTQRGSLDAQTTVSATAAATAAAYLRSDIHSRSSMIASANGELAAAFSLISQLNIGGGVSSIAQASLEFQAAASLAG